MRPCGKEFSLTHALHCAKGGYSHLRHNEIRDVFANLMDDVCHDVQIAKTSIAISFARWNKSQPRSAKKRGKPYADTKSYIRTKISFALLRSCVLCLRGCRALKPRVLSETSISAVVEEGKLHWVWLLNFIPLLIPWYPIFILILLTSSLCALYIYIGALLSTC